MTPDSSKTLDSDNPVTRVESLLSSIASNSAAMRRAYDSISDLQTQLESAMRRQDAVMQKLDALDDRYLATLKAGHRHSSFMTLLRQVKSVLGYGCSSKGDPESCVAGDGQRSILGILSEVDKVRKEIASTPLMQSGEQFVVPVAKDLEAIKSLYRVLHSLLGSPLPKAAEPAAVGTVADNDAWVSLLLRIREAGEDGKLRLVAAAMRAAADDIYRVSRQAEKMEVRARDDGSESNERDVANRKSYALRKSVEVIRKRMTMLAASFYSKREREMTRIADATREAAAALRADGVTRDTLLEAKAFRNRHPVQRQADDILGLDASLDSGKGVNPTLGNLMKYYKKNAQRRIANG